MSRLRRRMMVLSAVALVCGCALVLWKGDPMGWWRERSVPVSEEPSASDLEKGSGSRPSRGLAARGRLDVRPWTDSLSDLTPFPPSPPLPNVPPEASQEERKKAFELTQSVDHIVLKNEPMDVEGRNVSIQQILRELQGTRDFQQLLPTIQESEIGGYVRKPIFPNQSQAPPASYYGVRAVRRGENLWKIHYRIIQEYMARRHIILPPRADEPTANGRSSGVGRLLKFIEKVVFVYNMDRHVLEMNINVIHPDSVLVFFKITDLFAVLDQLKPEDLQWVRFVHDRLRLESPMEKRDLLGRKAFEEGPERIPPAAGGE